MLVSYIYSRVRMEDCKTLYPFILGLNKFQDMLIEKRNIYRKCHSIDVRVKMYFIFRAVLSEKMSIVVVYT